MAILQEDMVQMSSQTFDKGIEEGALGMMMGILQKSQYSFPQRSAVREIGSNAVDALSERNVAISILTGKSTVAEHYEDHAGTLYKDSTFRPDYYDLKWLSDKNEVHIMYHNNGNLERDELTIRDFGVGLWGDRLRGYFNLGYSTKRNSKFALGKFGIGAKSALSTGVPYFTIVTRYNGKKTAFNVYNNKIEPITPFMDMNTGATREFFEMETQSGAMKVYYEPTTEKNGVDIVLQVKKHHKNQYLDAVRSQLMYFKEVVFMEITNDHIHIHPTRAEILYEDEGMVISNNTFHNVPHLLIDKVNYGNINFTELELESRKGNIGIKVRAEDVTVNPSRETVIWDDVTKESILGAFNRVVLAASKRLERELTDTDIMNWHRAVANLSTGYRGNDPVINAMANIVDFNKVQPAFQGNKDLKWSFPLLCIMRAREVKITYGNRGTKRIMKLERETVASKGRMFGTLPLVRRQDGDPSNVRKNKYLASTKYPQGYIEMLLPVPYAPGAVDAPSKYKYYLSDDDVLALGASISGTTSYEFKRMEASKRKAFMVKAYAVADYVIDEFYATSKVLDYAEVEVPETFKATAEEEEEIVEDEIGKVERQNLEEVRKALGTTLVFTPNNGFSGTRKVVDSQGQPYDVDAKFTMEKLELNPSLVDTWDEDEIYFCSKEDEEALHMAARISRPISTLPDKEPARSKALEKYKGIKGQYRELPDDPYTAQNLEHFTARNIKLIMVSKDNAKYYKDFKHIRQFFMDVTKGVLNMSEHLIKWNTARLLRPNLYKLKFLQNFSLNTDLQQEYLFLRKYCDDYYTKSDNTYGMRMHHVQDLQSYLDKAGEFQIYVSQNPDDKEGIAQMAQVLFNPDPDTLLHNARAIDLKVYNKYLELLDYAEPVHTLLGEVRVLTGGHDRQHCEVYAELEQELRLYIQSKGAEVLLTYKSDQ
jgi:hypothetical protein